MKTTTIPSLILLGWITTATAQEPPQPAESSPTIQANPEPQPEASDPIKEVTLYQGTALITRHIKVPAKKEGSFEIIVKGLPTATDPESVFADEADGLEVRSVTCRKRSSEETNRVKSKVAQLDETIKNLTRKITISKNEIALRRIRQDFLKNLGNFAAPAARQEMAHGVLQATELEKVTKMQFKEYETASQEIMKFDLEITADSEALAILRSERDKLVSGPTQIYDAVVFVEKTGGKEAHFDLNYLVTDCGWSPVYNVRGISGGKNVQVEFNALIHQVSGENWDNTNLILSTASPTVNAQNPELTPLYVRVQQSQNVSEQQLANVSAEQVQRYKVALKGKEAANRKGLTGKSVQAFAEANFTSNDLAASAQLVELSLRSSQLKQINQQREDEDLAIQYELPKTVSLISRREAQMVPVLNAKCPAEFYHVATPVLTSAVFREAELINTSDRDLLGGKVNVYLDDKFIGRTEMPTIARGRNYTLGFGVDGQIRARRTLVDRTETVQGGNRLIEIGVEVVLENFKDRPVPIRVRERTPFMDDSTNLRVSLGRTSQPVSSDRDYSRFEKPKGILRWDLNVAPGAREKATSLTYAYRIEFDKSVSLEEVSGEKKSALRSELIERFRLQRRK